MPQSPFASPESAQRWQFGIQGMLIFTLSVAIGASVSQTNIANWLTIFAVEQTDFRQPVEIVKTGFGGGMLAVAVFWLCLGLVYQIRDIQACLKANPGLEKARKAGGQFEIFWRVGIVALLLGSFLILFLVNMRILILPESGDHGWKVGAMLREAVLLLSLLIIIGSVPAKSGLKLPAILKHILGGLFYALAIYYVSKTLVHVLVAIACMGIDKAFPLQLSLCDPRHFARTLATFYRWSAISAIVVPLNFFFLRRLARQWPAGAGRRLLWSGLLALGIAENVRYVLWTMAVGYPTIAPFHAEIGGTVMWHSWIALVILTTISSAVPAYRMSAEPIDIAEDSKLAWRRNPRKYYHEQRTVLLLFAAALLWIMADIYFEARRNPSFPLSELGNLIYRASRIRSYWDFWNELFFFLMPALFLWFGLLLLTLHRAFARRIDPHDPQSQMPRLNWAKFTAVWLAMAAFTVCGLLALIWISFGLWFSPWYIGR
jgi:hypothetical protein